MFLAGEQDIVMSILGITETSQLERMMAPVVPELRSVELLCPTPGIGSSRSGPRRSTRRWSAFCGAFRANPQPRRDFAASQD
jgi:hypothetical protein